ncbi:MAG TPA: glycerol-3-phosphate 1-O-acyltransferase PlsY [Syntrophomonadaceae bacterium]|nr:glycerol-3-phosphate 1-O-acyltransferase PlsY [Syntrophomonadaceae bacterium]
MKLVGLIILCYFIGSIPFSYIFTRLFTKEDIRKRGSGNVGATNVLRTAGPAVASLALAGDVLKGVLAGWLGSLMTRYTGLDIYLIVCPVAVVIGHCYPLTLKLKGGKGVATAAGVLLVMMPKVLLVVAVIFVLTIVISRYVSLGSCTAALFLPIVIIAAGKPWPNLTMGSILCILVIYRHRSNLLRLQQGIESRIGQKV